MSRIPLFCQFHHDGWRLVPKERYPTGMIHVVGCGRVADGYAVDLMISDCTFVDVESAHRAIRMDSSARTLCLRPCVGELRSAAARVRAHPGVRPVDSSAM